MADNDQPEQLMLRMLRNIDVKLDMVVKRLEALEGHSIGIATTLLAMRKDIQNLDERVSRLEMRLELREVAPT
jgi:archaellum component FlaC